MITTSKTPYDEKFYDTLTEGALRSARAVAPIVLNFIPVRSVVDFGCGRGTWLKAFRENGVETILGIDGSHVNKKNIMIKPEEFCESDISCPMSMQRTFDLAVCLEVGEHLAQRSATGLVRSLVSAAPIILFSAALPGQGGTHHVNEQWPVYWERLFASHGLTKYDVIRPLIWSNRDVEWWYRQNIYLFAAPNTEPLCNANQFEPEFMLVAAPVANHFTFQGSSKISKFLHALSQYLLQQLHRRSTRS